jgi:hypothetical protein
MSDFIVDGDDYLDKIKTHEDLTKFERLKQIWESGDLGKPVKECLSLLIEFDNMRQDLNGERRHKFLIMGDPKMN